MSEIRICEKREEKKDLVYLNLEADRKGIHLHIYLCVLLCCNLKIEQRKHLSAIGSPALLALCFHWPSPGAESLSNLSNLVWEDPLELMYSYLPLQAGLNRAGGPDPNPARFEYVWERGVSATSSNIWPPSWWIFFSLLSPWSFLTLELCLLHLILPLWTSNLEPGSVFSLAPC